MERLESIGWGPVWMQALAEVDPRAEWMPARVTVEQRGSYGLAAAEGDLRAEISGKLSYLAAGPEELPTVGDWVAAGLPPGGERAVVHHVLPRRTVLTRRAPERPSRAQLLAANVDVVFVVTSANLDFNPRRIERTLAVVAESGAEAVLVLSKLDLCDDEAALRGDARAAAGGAPVLALSAHTGAGLPDLPAVLGAGRTGVLIGSSGVGKSTLTNRLLGAEVQATREVRADDDRGRHATSHRELFVLPQGGVLIDTPGLREIGLWDDGGGAAAAFPEIAELAERCRFHDCAHASEPGCEVQRAIASGELAAERLASLRKLEREAEVVREKRDARARHERRKERKRFAKHVRSHKDRKRGRQ